MADAHPNDGMLMVQLAQWGSMLGLEDAWAVVFADDFDPDSADHLDTAVRKLLTYGETIGTMTKHGLIPTALILDWVWIAGLWARIGPAALRARRELGEPRLYENLERLAQAG